eukprot:CAMPEP_0172913496 /NCGR_PEP_ID=MMETSP1075-20121228/190484_1 /TAXON_ID=2916 /ORGANISM="Ceratium fusus, Strain PA161109" /LENGTH=217 /DNA_ID=CAMNT_0013772221 /DNA_START=394 /DNA_END=1044 /DNA_ORIENTATION=-
MFIPTRSGESLNVHCGCAASDCCTPFLDSERHHLANLGHIAMWVNDAATPHLSSFVVSRGRCQRKILGHQHFAANSIEQELVEPLVSKTAPKARPPLCVQAVHRSSKLVRNHARSSSCCLHYLCKIAQFRISPNRAQLTECLHMACMDLRKLFNVTPILNILDPADPLSIADWNLHMEKFSEGPWLGIVQDLFNAHRSRAPRFKRSYVFPERLVIQT